MQWDELVRVADEVGVRVDCREISRSWFSQFSNERDAIGIYSCVTKGNELIPFPDFLSKLKGEEKWEPKAGEMVEVSHQGITWFEREFIGHSRGKYVGWTSDGETHAWAKCRKARPTVTRTEAEQLLNKRIID